MRYEISERIQTDRPSRDVLNLALDQFRKISSSAMPQNNDHIVVKGIEATFGSANRSDETIVSFKQVDDGWLLIADVTYKPSVFFWIITIVLLFTYVAWIFPIIFYLTQKNAVRQAIENCFARVRNELAGSSGHKTLSSPQRSSALDDLDKLASLKERGVITEEEFLSKKAQLLEGL
jgi:Short C-terminal domain